MSKSYPDLPLTNFPESTDAQKVYEDVGINTVDDMNLYYQYIHAKNFAAANQLLADKPLLQRCIVNALSLNTMEHRLLALQRMYLSDFKAFIENDVTKEDIRELWEKITDALLKREKQVKRMMISSTYQNMTVNGNLPF